MTIRRLLAFLLLFVAAMAQTTHSVTLNWTDTLNPAGTTYNVYRAAGVCTGTPAFTKIASALSAKTYQDTTVTPGNYCYAVTAAANGLESAQSNAALAAVASFAPTQLTVTVQ